MTKTEKIMKIRGKIHGFITTFWRLLDIWVDQRLLRSNLQRPNLAFFGLYQKKALPGILWPEYKMAAQTSFLPSSAAKTFFAGKLSQMMK